MSPEDYLELVMLRLALAHQTKSPPAIRQMCRDHGIVPNEGQILSTQRRVRQMLDDYTRGMPEEDED